MRDTYPSFRHLEAQRVVEHLHTPFHLSPHHPFSSCMSILDLLLQISHGFTKDKKHRLKSKMLRMTSVGVVLVWLVPPTLAPTDDNLCLIDCFPMGHG